MKERSIILVSLGMLLVAFLASGMQAEISSNAVYEVSNEECSSGLELMDGKYTVPCGKNGYEWSQKRLCVNCQK